MMNIVRASSQVVCCALPPFEKYSSMALINVGSLVIRYIAQKVLSCGQRTTPDHPRCLHRQQLCSNVAAGAGSFLCCAACWHFEALYSAGLCVCAGFHYDFHEGVQCAIGKLVSVCIHDECPTEKHGSHVYCLAFIPGAAGCKLSCWSIMQASLAGTHSAPFALAPCGSFASKGTLV